MENNVGDKWPGKFSLKMPDFHVAFRGSFTCPYIYDMGFTALLPLP
jgi:hypothetical protein